MDEHCKVSVVMSVFDKPDDVRKTINSVLSQGGVDLEFIIINDGAEQSVADVLQTFSDPRIRIINNPNQGLTKSLIDGCAIATFENIARIDAGDIMLDDRLRLQAEVLQHNSEVGLVASYVEVVDVDDHFLYSVKDGTRVLSQSTLSIIPSELKTPIHVSIMFRKSVYFDVGGYRAEFYFAQDCDLWSRMLRVCKLHVIEEELTQIIFSSSGLSGRFSDIQTSLKGLVAIANDARNNNYRDLSEDEILDRAQEISNARHALDKEASQEIDTIYFLASILTKNKSPAARKYWVKFLKKRPWHLVGIIRFLLSCFNSREA